jgi:hypothetical protein
MRTVHHSVGRVLAAFGAVGLLASLFMPWYGPPSADYLTIFGNAAVDWFSGKRNPDGWQALSVIDIYLAALAAVAVVTCAFSHGRAMQLLTVATTAAAAVGVGLIVYRLIEPFAPFHEPIYGPSGKPLSVNSFVDPRIGIFVALASAVAIFAGSILISFRSWRFRSITAVSGKPGRTPLSVTD